MDENITNLHIDQKQMLVQILSNPILMQKLAIKLDWDGVVELKTYIEFMVNQNGFTKELHSGDLNDLRKEYIKYKNRVL